jgi:transcriptional regulator
MAPDSGASSGEALVVFAGPHADVSPGWYPSKAEHGRVVPTWNYEAVHVYGELVWRDERDWLLANVAALSDRFEAAQDRPWSVDDAPADFIARLAAGIVGVELRITRVEAKRKLSQNRSEADRQGVVAGLERSGETAVAALMRSPA